MGRGHAGRAHERAGHRHQRGLQQGPFGALRLHHWRGHRAHAVRRQASAHPEHGHGRQAAGVRRDHHRLGDGVGLQPVHHVQEPVHRRLPVRGRVAGQAGRSRLRAWEGLPELPGVLREAARRAGTLGQAGGRRARRADGPGGPGRRRHRRQGLHVRFVRGSRRAADADLLRRGRGQHEARHLPRVQGRRSPYRAHRTALPGRRSDPGQGCAA